MNDRYLYRAKRKSDKKWIYGNLIQTDDGVYMIQNYVPQHLIGKYEVDPSTICQCTGKHDIPENKMIYEHDFVSFLDTYSTENGYAEQYCIGEVLWDDEELADFIEQVSTDSMETISFGTKEYEEIWEHKETALQWLQAEVEEQDGY